MASPPTGLAGNEVGFMTNLDQVFPAIPKLSKAHHGMSQLPCLGPRPPIPPRPGFQTYA